MNQNLKTGDNWETPKVLYDALNAEFDFDFDPCPLNPNPQQDGLVVEWGGRNFINPPYTRKLKEAFIRRAVAEQANGKLSVMLLPVSTSTKVFHESILPNAEIRFIRGRVHFTGVNTKGEFVTNKPAMHDSMICIFRPK